MFENSKDKIRAFTNTAIAAYYINVSTKPQNKVNAKCGYNNWTEQFETWFCWIVLIESDSVCLKD